MRHLAAALSLALLAGVAAPLVRAQDKNMGKKDENKDKDEKAEQEKLAAEMTKEAKRFVAAVKITAHEALAHATQRQAGVVTALRAEQQIKLDKANKESRNDCFQVTVVRDQVVTTVQVDPEGHVTEKPAAPDESRDALQVVKRLTAAKAVLSIPVVADKIASHEKAQVISVLLEDREERKDKKGEAYLVYALVGDQVAWYEVDATTGEVEKKRT